MSAAEGLGALVLLAAVAPLGRIVADGSFRRVFPRHWWGLTAALLLWAAVVIGVAAWVPGLLVPAALLATVMWAMATWRARPGHGAHRALPPGSISATASIRDLAHRDAHQRSADRHGPVFKSAQFWRPIVCVVGLERGLRLVRDHASALGPSPLPFTQQLVGGFLRYMDDERHDRYGPAFRRAISSRVVDTAGAVAQQAARRELGALAPGADLEPALHRIAHEAVTAALLGLVPGDRLAGHYDELSARFAASTIMHPLNRQARETLGALRALVGEQATRADGGVPSALLGLREADGGPPDPVVVDNLLMMAKIGTANVVGLLRWLLVLASDEPDRCDALERTGATPDALDAFVLETLRLAQSEYVYRRLTADVDLDGHRLPAGWLVRICVAESHRDPEVFPDPDRLVADRFVGCRPPPDELCPFGFGRHACNAAGIATTVARAVLGEAVRADLRVDHTGRLTRDLRHWSHWRPAPPLLVSADAG